MSQVNLEIQNLINVVSRINLSAKDDKRYDFLHERLEAGILSDAERIEYIELTLKAREINVERMKNLAKLSVLTGKSMRDLMRELKLYSPDV